MRDRRASTHGFRPAIRSLLILIGGLTVLGLASSPAVAQEPDHGKNDQIVLTGTLVVEADQTVDTALIFDGPARVDGTVEETLVVFNGDAEVTGTVRGDVVVFNGDLVIRSGAEVGGDLVTNSTPTVEDGATVRGSQTSVVTRFDVDVVGFAGRLAWWVGYSVSSLVLGLLLLAFAPRLEAKVRTVVKMRLGVSIGWGAGLFFLLPIGSVLLLVTIVGIPLGLFTMLALALIYSVGYVVAATAVGGLILRDPSTSRFFTFLAGWLPLRILALIPFLGGWLWFLASAWGLGLLAVAIRSGSMLTPPAPAAPIPPAPPPAPAPAG
jgi:hypothetical protein